MIFRMRLKVRSIESDAQRDHDMLEPCPDEWLAFCPVSTRVGNVRNEDAGLVTPLTMDPFPA